MALVEPQTAVTSVMAGELYARLLRDESLFILDMRNKQDFARWRIEGRDALTTRNVPYYDFIAYVLGHLPVFPPEYIEIKRVNLGLSTPSEQEAAELELGKDICSLNA